jgi:hypothetical protein
MSLLGEPQGSPKFVVLSQSKARPLFRCVTNKVALSMKLGYPVRPR